MKIEKNANYIGGVLKERMKDDLAAYLLYNSKIIYLNEPT